MLAFWITYMKITCGKHLVGTGGALFITQNSTVELTAAGNSYRTKWGCFVYPV